MLTSYASLTCLILLPVIFLYLHLSFRSNDGRSTAKSVESDFCVLFTQYQLEVFFECLRLLFLVNFSSFLVNFSPSLIANSVYFWCTLHDSSWCSSSIIRHHVSHTFNIIILTITGIYSIHLRILRPLIWHISFSFCIALLHGTFSKPNVYLISTFLLRKYVDKQKLEETDLHKI